MDPHELSEERSIAMHAAIAAKIVRDPSLVDRARRRIDALHENGLMHPVYAERWRAVLALPVDALHQRLVARDDEMRALRQSSPFAGALDPRERWAIRRSITGIS